MATTKLKIGPLPDRTPVKVTINVEPALHADLKLYADLYQQAYGNSVDVPVLIPSILEAFLARDAALKAAKRKSP